MNTAVLGLKLLLGGDSPRRPEGGVHTAHTARSTSAPFPSDPLPADVLDLIADINVSCHAAVDILNDLLTFEKLERCDMRQETRDMRHETRDERHIL